MKRLLGHTSKDQKGFTLIELVVVIAILGVMAAIAVPMVNNFLASSKEQAYIADTATIQAAVDAYYSSPGNERVLGRRQYPIFGADKFNDNFVFPDSTSVADTIVPPLAGNPLGGTQGGSPLWSDGDVSSGGDSGNGIRDAATGTATASELKDEVLNDEDALVASDPTVLGWYVAVVKRETTDYIVDSRDYFIDFQTLVDKRLLEKPPASASPDNAGSNATGSYSWYVDSLGTVRSLYYFFPESDQTGFQTVFP